MDETSSWLVDGGHSSSSNELWWQQEQQEQKLILYSNSVTAHKSNNCCHYDSGSTEKPRKGKQLVSASKNRSSSSSSSSSEQPSTYNKRANQTQQQTSSSSGGGGSSSSSSSSSSNKSSSSSNNNNNNNNNTKSSSYSKLFRQYLPLALHLNGSKASAGVDRYAVNQQHQSSVVASSRLVVNAFNRLKLSATDASVSETANQEKLFLKRENCDKLDANNNSNSNNSNNEISSNSETSKLLVKRKGFLYLKKSSVAVSKNHLYEVANQAHHQHSNKLSSLSWKLPRKDLNNNDFSSLLECQNEYDEELVCEQLPVCKLQLDRKRKLREQNTNSDRVINHKLEEEVVADKRAQEMLSSEGTSKTKSSKAAKESSSKKRNVICSTALLMSCLLIVALLTFATSIQQVALGQQLQSSSQGLPVPPPPFRSQSAVGPAQGAIRPQPAAGSLVASINCNKIKGHVTLTPNGQGGSTVSTQISSGPAGEVYQWSVHQFPVKPGAAMCSCSPMILGLKLLDLSEMHGNLPSEQEFTVQSSLNLFGPESPVGHSLMLRGMKTGMVACATFLPTSRKSNYRAKFHSPLSGSVTIFQTAFGTSFISHLMYSNGTRRHSMHRFDLVKSEDDMVTSAPLTSLVGASGSNSARAGLEQLAWEQREHEHELSQCKRFSAGEPLFKNISYQLSVSTENFGMRGRSAWVLPQIPFETFSSVFVVIYSEHDPSDPIACAPLRFVKPKTAAAKFQSVSVQGSVIFSQDSPYDPTIARINLNLPNSDGHSYGIDELPMIIRRKSDTRVCPNIREIIYNPHHIEPSSVPAEGEATSDQYAVGDLSGKYGSLTGKSVEKIQINDFNLPLYGPISVVGRAMTIYSAEGVAIACSNVELTTPMTTAFATFDFGIQGQFIFRQPVNDCNGDTYVYIEVSKPVVPGSLSTSADTTRSLDHNWHIHVNPVDSGLDHLSTTECQSAGPHYNPYNTSTGSIYSRDCTPFNVLRCELGDLSAKMFTIEIPPYRVKGGQEPDIGKFFGTDIDLPLCGPVSIVNRSVVVHVQDFSHQRLACSTVIEFKPRIS